MVDAWLVRIREGFAAAFVNALLCHQVNLWLDFGKASSGSGRYDLSTCARARLCLKSSHFSGFYRCIEGQRKN